MWWFRCSEDALIGGNRSSVPSSLCTPCLWWLVLSVAIQELRSAAACVPALLLQRGAVPHSASKPCISPSTSAEWAKSNDFLKRKEV